MAVAGLVSVLASKAACKGLLPWRPGRYPGHGPLAAERSRIGSQGCVPWGRRLRQPTSSPARSNAIARRDQLAGNLKRLEVIAWLSQNASAARPAVASQSFCVKPASIKAAAALRYVKLARLPSFALRVSAGKTLDLFSALRGVSRQERFTVDLAKVGNLRRSFGHRACLSLRIPCMRNSVITQSRDYSRVSFFPIVSDQSDG